MENMTPLQIAYLVSAGFGGIFVLGQFVLSMLGAGGNDASDLDSGSVDGSPVDGMDADHTDSDTGFKILSLQSISSFLFMFGLTGLALNFGGTLGGIFSLLGASVVGVVYVFIIAKLFTLFLGFQSSGTLTNKTLEDCYGKVYLPVGGPDKPGRVIINQGNRQRELDAVTLNNETIEVGANIQVVSHIGSQVTVIRT